MSELSFSKVYPKYHFRKDQLTNFKELVLSGEKPHTCRGSYITWKKREIKCRKGQEIIKGVQWSGAPYNSKREDPFMVWDYKNPIHVVEFKINREGVMFVDGYKINKHNFVKNDGFRSATPLDDFYTWVKWKKNTELEMCVIYLNDFRY